MITIVGGGIGGLTTALAFEKLGIEYQIFEKAPQLNEVGAGIWLAPNPLQVMDWLGILNEVQQKGNTINRITLATQMISPLSDISQNMVKEKYGFSTVAIHRAKLQGLLYNHIPNHKITLGKAFQKYQYLDNQKLQLTFSDGSTVQTDYLIGADGIHSAIRKQLFPNSQIRYAGQSCWRGIADYSLENKFQQRGMELWGDQVRFGISQIAENQVYWFAVVKSPANQKDDRKVLKNKLLEIYQSFHPLVNTLIQNTPIEKIMRNDIIDLKPMKKWYNDKICLIGDAAHSTTPNLGQGAAQAIEDAYYLAKTINETATMKTVFSKFQSKRYQKVNFIVKQSWTTGRTAHFKYGQNLRNFMMKAMPSKIMAKQMMKLYVIEK